MTYLLKIKKNILFKRKEYQVTKIMRNFFISKKDIQFIQDFVEESIEKNYHKLEKILFWILNNNESKKIRIKSNQFHNIIQYSNLKKQDKDGWNALMIALFNYKKQNLYFTKEQWDYWIEHSDLKQQNKDGCNALMIALSNYKNQNLYFTKEQWDDLIQHSDLNQQDNTGANAFMHALIYSKEQNLYFAKEQWDYWIEHSDLNQQMNNGMNVFLMMMFNQKEKQLNFTKEQWKNIWNNLHIEQKEKNFRIICEEYESQNYFKEDILFVLNDLDYKPTENMKKFLYEKKYIEIIQMMEQQKFFLKMNEDLPIKEKDKKTIKI